MSSTVSLAASGPRPARLMRALRRNLPSLLGYATLLVLLLAYGILQPRLLSTYLTTSLFNNTLPLALVAMGQTIVILTGGIDLSVGALVSLSSVLIGRFIGAGVPSMLGVSALALLAASAAGLLNGLFVGWARLQPVIVTLATLSAWGGAALLILPTAGGDVPDDYTTFFTGNVGVVPNAAILLAIVLLAWATLRRTTTGLLLYAVGSDETAAWLNDVPVRRVKVLAYTLSGFFSGLAGIVLTANTATGDPTGGVSYTLTSIVAVVLGGTSLAGGKGGAAGSVAGAFILSVIINILFFAHIPSFYQNIVQGVLLLAAVGVGSLYALRWGGR